MNLVSTVQDSSIFAMKLQQTQLNVRMIRTTQLLIEKWTQPTLKQSPINRFLKTFQSQTF